MLVKVFISLSLFFGQFVMTPERQAAMDQASVTIRSKQGQITAMQTQITAMQGMVTKAQSDKAKLISDSKAKLGLDATWSWSDTANTFVQAK